MLHFPTSSEITIEVNGRTLAVAQSYRAKSTQESRYVEAFGTIEPVGTIGGRTKHQLELTRVATLTEAMDDGIDFYTLTDFNVVIVKPDRRIIYSGCAWSNIEENANLGEPVLEQVSIVASRRLELR